MANFKLPYTGTNWNKHNGVGVTLIENWFEERSVADQMISEHQKAQNELNRRMKEDLEKGEVPLEIQKIQKQSNEIDKAQERLKIEQENLTKMKLQLQEKMDHITENLEKIEKEKESNLPYQNVVASTNAYQKHNLGPGKKGRMIEAELMELAKKQLEEEPDDGVEEWKSTFQKDYCFDFKSNIEMPDEETILKYSVPITYWNDNIKNKDINVYCSTSEKEKEECKGNDINFPRHTNFTKPINEYGLQANTKFKDF
ncbi:hypothetical protein BCR32DRAFT_247191 [Anaeromyces robustus]|uniref:Uncharacterized protein n=1 Tax=Anaeromyces robustus TaxID=1754192 RepID=A0A1Y1WYD2_9FUNG|nr:hypothetical protein BCR32DRAFT_247191 [Anaeromyces robustus]|eukprot:ORX78385.1 hypothetical protein BCR32DRAFT_247191 [Anaeromyces robustus]